MNINQTIPTNTDDMIDSRDVIAAIDSLESDRSDLIEAVDEARDALDDIESMLEDCDDEAEAVDLENKRAEAEIDLERAEDELDDWEGDEGETLRELRELADDGETLADWLHGETLIRDSYFVEYARELADDIGAIDRNASWPLDCIDWEQAADELKQDYTDLDFAGVTFWIRS